MKLEIVGKIEYDILSAFPLMFGVSTIGRLVHWYNKDLLTVEGVRIGLLNFEINDQFAIKNISPLQIDFHQRRNPTTDPADVYEKPCLRITVTQEEFNLSH